MMLQTYTEWCRFSIELNSDFELISVFRQFFFFFWDINEINIRKMEFIFKKVSTTSKMMWFSIHAKEQKTFSWVGKIAYQRNIQDFRTVFLVNFRHINLDYKIELVENVLLLSLDFVFFDLTSIFFVFFGAIQPSSTQLP